ncbi:FG-GAP-like repeat-containing protein [Actinomycetota bacterium]
MTTSRLTALLSGALATALALTMSAASAASAEPSQRLDVICDGIGSDTVTITGDLARGGTARFERGPLRVVGKPGFSGQDRAGKKVSVAPSATGVLCTAEQAASGDAADLLPATQAQRVSADTEVTGTLTFAAVVEADTTSTAAAATVEPGTKAFPFQAKLASYLASRPGVATVAVRELSSNTVYTYTKTTSRQVTASIVKVELMAAVMMRAQDAGRSLTSWEKSQIVPMIRYSDNAAASALFNSIGGRAGLDAASRRLGLTETVADPGGRWGLTTTTARDQTRLMQHFARATGLINETNRSYGLTQMRSVASDQDWGVTAGPPAGTVAVKNGWLPRTDGYHVNSNGYSYYGPAYTISVLTNNYSGTLSGQIATIEGVSRIVWANRSVLVPRGARGDMNGGGRADLIGVTDGGTVYRWLGDGAGGFGPRETIGTGFADTTWWGTPGDVNRDGRTDVVVRRTYGTLQLLLSTSDGRLGTPKTIGYGWHNYYGIAAVPDADLNGTLDLVARKSGGYAELWSISDSGQLTKVRDLGRPFTYYNQIIGISDVNGGGRGDVIGTSLSGTRLRAFFSSGTVMTPSAVWSDGWDRYRLVTSPGTLNGGSYDDIVAADKATGAMYRWWGTANGGTTGQTQLPMSATGLKALF